MNQAEYERHEAHEAATKERAVESAPLSERKEAQGEFFEAMRDPALIAERIGWMIDGNYGYGIMQKAKRVVASPRMNRAAALTHMVAVHEWSCPARMAADAWKKLTSAEKGMLDKAVEIVISEAEKEEGMTTSSRGSGPTLFGEVKRLGIPHDHHESDLYIPVTTETRALVAKFDTNKNATVFKSNTDGKQWFDIPFAYNPFWDKKKR